MGDMQVPASALYGPQTARAVQNFPISGKHFPRSFIRALGMIKSAAATMNGRMGQGFPQVPPKWAGIERGGNNYN
jgi:fumarate hydratase, class II